MATADFHFEVAVVKSLLAKTLSRGALSSHEGQYAIEGHYHSERGVKRHSVEHDGAAQLTSAGIATACVSFAAHSGAPATALMVGDNNFKPV